MNNREELSEKSNPEKKEKRSGIYIKNRKRQQKENNNKSKKPNEKAMLLRMCAVKFFKLP